MCVFFQAKAKAEKNRRELEENLLKQSHAQRQEVSVVEEKSTEEETMSDWSTDRQTDTFSTEFLTALLLCNVYTD